MFSENRFQAKETHKKHKTSEKNCLKLCNIETVKMAAIPHICAKLQSIEAKRITRLISSTESGCLQSLF